MPFFGSIEGESLGLNKWEQESPSKRSGCLSAVCTGAASRVEAEKLTGLHESKQRYEPILAANGGKSKCLNSCRDPRPLGGGTM